MPVSLYSAKRCQAPAAPAPSPLAPELVQRTYSPQWPARSSWLCLSSNCLCYAPPNPRHAVCARLRSDGQVTRTTAYISAARHQHGFLQKVVLQQGKLRCIRRNYGQGTQRIAGLHRKQLAQVSYTAEYENVGTKQWLITLALYSVDRASACTGPRPGPVGLSAKHICGPGTVKIRA